MPKPASMVDRAEEYFAWRRKLGYRPRTERDEVLHFARRVDEKRQKQINLDFVVDWARDSRRGGRRYIASRYEAVRRFLARIASSDSGITVPPPGYLGGSNVRTAVHIYTEAETRELLAAALALPPATGLRPHTIRTLLGLLEATGLRIGEALNLDVSDVDLKLGTIFIRRDKLGASRRIPVQTSTVDALREYSDRRNRRHRSPRTPAFFLTNSFATRVEYQIATNTFRLLRRMLGWRQRPMPRVHDLRHTFAVRTLLDWMRAGKDVDVELPALSAYLGHAHPQSTYWYFSAVPELSHLITGNMERLELLRPGSPVI